MRLTSGMRISDGLCPFTWSSLSSLCHHHCWHPAGHPGCHNCEYCGRSVARQSWESEVIEPEQPAAAIAAELAPAPDVAPKKKRARRPKPAPGPCEYMFFSLSFEDYGPHAHECRRPAGHKSQHVCCRCGHRVNSNGPRERDRTESPRSWARQRQYLKTTPLKTLQMFPIDDSVLRTVERAEAVMPPAFEPIAPLKKQTITFKQAARYRAFAQHRRWAGQLVAAMIGLDILIFKEDL